jgi:hypothetical protein
VTARAGRLAGALLVAAGEEYFLVGNPRRPCDWRSAGFEPPGAIDAVARPYVPLARAGTPALSGPWLDLAGVALSAEELARRLAQRLVIERNGSVSDRLWRLVMRADPDGDDPPPDAVVDGRWLAETPVHVWAIVREAVLRCL